jgi:predicted pyridoxine 5'-phosphate oxidase superfamily flavin-nucleotide-binding protein
MLTEDIIQAFAGQMTPKFLATADREEKPNVVPVISLMAPDPETLVFGEFMVWKTRRNLMDNPRVTALVLTESLETWTVRGDFVDFRETGPFVDLLNESPMFRYNAYLGIRRAGVIRVREVTAHEKLSRAGLVVDMARVGMARVFTTQKPDGEKREAAMPRQVEEKFSRVKAVRVFSWVDGKDGYPDAVPVMSMRPAGQRTLLFAPGPFGKKLETIEPGSAAAASVITFDPVAYQVKGTWGGFRRPAGFSVGRMDVTEVYSASPPRPGERIA